MRYVQIFLAYFQKWRNTFEFQRILSKMEKYFQFQVILSKMGSYFRISGNTFKSGEILSNFREYFHIEINEPIKQKRTTHEGLFFV